MKVKFKPKAGTPVSGATQSNRETYLIAAIALITPIFEENEAALPPVRVSVGWPGGRRGKLDMGSCWKKEASKDQRFQIFVSPMIDDTIRALDVLMHELCHAATNCEGHNAAFTRIARAVGLEGRPTQTVAGDDLIARLNEEVVKRLGEYPHAALNPEKSGETKQGTRLIKCLCPASGYTVRTTRAWIEQYGPPISPVTKEPMFADMPKEAEQAAKEDAA